MAEYIKELELHKNIISMGVRKTDETDKLVCFCSDNPPKSDFENQIRGYIFDNNSNLILKSLPYAITLNRENLAQHSVGNLLNYRINIMKEGCAIRIFYYEGVWYTTTHRKLCAYKSKWGKKSFGEIFEENIVLKTGKPLSEFYELLNKDLAYIFLVGTTEETRIVSPSYYGVHLITCFDKSGKIVEDVNFENYYLDEIGFETIEEIFDYVSENIKYPFSDGAGIYMLSNTQCFKIFNSEYEKLALLRHNLPSINFAYLHNIFKKDDNEKFRKLYPKFEDNFNSYDDESKSICEDIFQKYLKRFVKKDVFVVNKVENNVLYHLHGLFLKNKKPIDQEDIKTIFQELPSSLNKIIAERRFITKEFV